MQFHYNPFIFLVCLHLFAFIGLCNSCRTECRKTLWTLFFVTSQNKLCRSLCHFRIWLWVGFSPSLKVAQFSNILPAKCGTESSVASPTIKNRQPLHFFGNAALSFSSYLRVSIFLAFSTFLQFKLSCFILVLFFSILPHFLHLNFRCRKV